MGSIMALTHAQPDEVIDLLPAPEQMAAHGSVSLLRTPHLQLLRLVMPEGHQMPGHRVSGAMTIQCLQGMVRVGTETGLRTLHGGQVLALSPAEPHDVLAMVASVLLVTLVHPAAN